LRDAQARRDAAYTEKGAKKTAKGSVFKDAADRLREAREEREALQKLVEDSEGVEHHLRDLNGIRDLRESAVAAAVEHTRRLELMAAQAAAVAVAQERVRLAQDEVTRIQRIGAEVETAERVVVALALGLSQATQALEAAHGRSRDAEAAFKAATETATAAGADSASIGTVARHRLDLRRVAAEQSAREAKQRIDQALAAQAFVDAAEAARTVSVKQLADAVRVRQALDQAIAEQQAAVDHLRRLDLLERALEARVADEQVAAARANVENHALVRGRVESETAEAELMVQRRAAITVPDLAALTPMRRLANDLAGARGALNVGVVVTVTPTQAVDIRVRKDGAPEQTMSIAEPLEIEASASVDVDLGAAAVRVRGGRREAQRTVQGLEQQWEREVAPHLAAAGAGDLDALTARVEEARALDTSIAAKKAELESLRLQLTTLDGAADTLAEASRRAKSARAALKGESLAPLATELAALGASPLDALRRRRQKQSDGLDAARARASQAGTEHALADERGRTMAGAFDAAVSARDGALAAFPEGVKPALSAARVALAAAEEEERAVAAEVAALERTIAAETARIEAAVSGTRAAEENAKKAVDVAQQAVTRAIAEHAAQLGRLEELRKLRDAQDLAGAEGLLREATSALGAVPVPEREVAQNEVIDARNAESRAKADLERIIHEIQRAHGALEQVGGSVARERLRDAIEAFEAAERREREVEAEYDAWLLLLQQMKEADAAQASNLGQTLGPAIASRFEKLTQQRYENVRLTAQLATEGVVVGGALRPADRMSVGTRDQLATLYRLSLAEYLKTGVVLDDQLVQSDDARMDWFRALLADKARAFQIVVFTCRPGDYLAAGAMPKGKAVWKDTDGGLMRALDLERAIQRR
jgi:hypothetical protein